MSFRTFFRERSNWTSPQVLWTTKTGKALSQNQKKRMLLTQKREKQMLKMIPPPNPKGEESRKTKLRQTKITEYLVF